MASALERYLRRNYGSDISTPKARRRAQWYMRWMDHEVLRYLVHNFYEIAPGVFRSNQPNHERFKRYKEMGIKTIINLRGDNCGVPYLFEKESCAELGLELRTFQFTATKAPDVRGLQSLIETFREMEGPFLMHCKSGADRTGLTSALYLMVMKGVSAEEALSQLSFKYYHIKRSTAGILDYFLETYIARNLREPIGFEAWLASEYDAAALTRDFAAVRNRK